jgi:hypothetical protein
MVDAPSLRLFSFIERFFATIYRERTEPLGTVSKSATGPDRAQVADFIAELATGLWRLRQKMLRPGTSEPLDEMRKPWRHLEALWDLLVQNGIKIQEYPNQPYNAGMGLRVVAFQPTEGITRETIVETIRPSVYLDNQLIQMGEVVVASPQATDTSTR